MIKSMEEALLLQKTSAAADPSPPPPPPLSPHPTNRKTVATSKRTQKLSPSTEISSDKYILGRTSGGARSDLTPLTDEANATSAATRITELLKEDYGKLISPVRNRHDSNLLDVKFYKNGTLQCSSPRLGRDVIGAAEKNSIELLLAPLYRMEKPTTTIKDNGAPIMEIPTFPDENVELGDERKPSIELGAFNRDHIVALPTVVEREIEIENLTTTRVSSPIEYETEGSCGDDISPGCFRPMKYKSIVVTQRPRGSLDQETSSSSNLVVPKCPEATSDMEQSSTNQSESRIQENLDTERPTKAPGWSIIRRWVIVTNLSLLACICLAFLRNQDANVLLAAMRWNLHHTVSNWTIEGPRIDGHKINHRFGASVAISADGKVLAAGAPDGAGYVQVYALEEEIWTLQGNVIFGVEEHDNLGNSVAISDDGSIIAMGVIGHQTRFAKQNVGAVRVFQFANNFWVPMGSMIEGDVADMPLGFSVALTANGTVLAIGASQFLLEHESGPNSLRTKQGYARVYQFHNEKWEQVGADMIGGEPGDGFGASIAISDDGMAVVVGAPLNDNNVGYVQPFQNQNGQWESLPEKIVGHSGVFFGASLSLSGDGMFLAIGSLSNTFEVYAYINATNQFQRETTREITSGSTNTGRRTSELDMFMNPVSIANPNGSLVIAMGSVEFFRNGKVVANETGLAGVVAGQNWLQPGFDMVERKRGDRFGSSIALAKNGLYLAVGAEGNPGNTGYVEVFAGFAP